MKTQAGNKVKGSQFHNKRIVKVEGKLKKNIVLPPDQQRFLEQVQVTVGQYQYQEHVCESQPYQFTLEMDDKKTSKQKHPCVRDTH